MALEDSDFSGLCNNGTGLDFLNLDSLNILHVSMPDEFTASVTMAKEGP